jgi:predicted outer membrane repeat protein
LGGGLAFENVGTVSGSTASVAGIGSCVFARNRAARGGAISLKDLRAPAAIYDCKIHDNVAQWVGGAIHVDTQSSDPQPGYLEIYHSTLAYNLTLGGDGVPIVPSGSALYIEPNTAGFPNLPVTVRSSILCANGVLSDTDITIAGVTAALVITYSDIQDAPLSIPPTWTNNISATPQFLSVPLRDFRLQAGSPCIDAASDVPLNPIVGAGIPLPRTTVGDLADINDNNMILELVPWELTIGLTRELDDSSVVNTGLNVNPPIGISDMGCHERQSGD